VFEVQPKQSALRRAWTDTKRSTLTIWYGLFITVSTAFVAIVGGLLATRISQDTAMEVSMPILMLVGWLLLIVLLIFSFNMMRAPYRQRDEARQIVASSLTDEVAVAVKKLEARQLAEHFAHWAGEIALGATILHSGFNRQGMADLVRIGVVEPRLQEGNAYPPTGPLYKPPRTLYFLTPLGRAVLARLEGAAGTTEKPENK
jgi:uncharacterized membrane protein